MSRLVMAACLDEPHDCSAEFNKTSDNLSIHSKVSSNHRLVWRPLAATQEKFRDHQQTASLRHSSQRSRLHAPRCRSLRSRHAA